MEEKINLSLFEDFFLFSSPADYAKILINTSNPDENKKKCSRDKRQNIRFKRRIKGISEAEKKYENADETLKIIEKILVYNKNAQKKVQLASKVDKRKSEPKTEESIAERDNIKKRNRC